MLLLKTRSALSLALFLLWPATAFAQMPPTPAQAEAPQVQIKVNFVSVSAADLDKSGVTFDRVPSEHQSASPGPTGPFLQYAAGDRAAHLLRMLHLGGKAVQAPLVTTSSNVAVTIQVNTQVPDQKAGFLLIQSGLTVTPRINTDGSVTLHVAIQPFDATGTPPAKTLATILRTVRSGDVIAVAGLPLNSGKPKSDQKLLIFIAPAIVGTEAQKADREQAGPFANEQPSLPFVPFQEMFPKSEKTVSIEVSAGDLRAVAAMLERQIGIKTSVIDGDKPYRLGSISLGGVPLSKALQVIAWGAGAKVTRNESGVYVFSPLSGTAQLSMPIPDAPVEGGTYVNIGGQTAIVTP